MREERKGPFQSSGLETLKPFLLEPFLASQARSLAALSSQAKSDAAVSSPTISVGVSKRGRARQWHAPGGGARGRGGGGVPGGAEAGQTKGKEKMGRTKGKEKQKEKGKEKGEENDAHGGPASELPAGAGPGAAPRDEAAGLDLTGNSDLAGNLDLAGNVNLAGDRGLDLVGMASDRKALVAATILPGDLD